MTRWIQHTVMRWRAAFVLLALSMMVIANDADGVGMAQVMTEKSLPDATVSVLDPESGTSSGTTGSDINLAVGDVLLFRFAVSPVPDKRNRGIQTYLTEYVPPNMEVVGVRMIDADGVTIKPRLPGLALDGCGGGSTCSNFNNLPCNAGTDNCDFAGGSIAQVHADTGIFFSNDSRLARTPNNAFISPTNGTQMSPVPNGISPDLTPLLGYSAPFFAHNAWDWTQVLAFGTSSDEAGTSGKGNAPYLYASPVAGPDTYYQYEATDTGGNGIEFNDVVGPWQRIVYPGSMIGTGDCRSNNVTCTPSADDTAQRKIVATNAGTDVTPANPQVARAIRFAMGQTQTGQPMYVEVALRVTAAFATDLTLDPNFGTSGGNVNCGEVFGSGLAFRGTGQDGDNHPWPTYIGSPQCVDLRLLLDIQVNKDLASGEEITHTIRHKNLSVSNEENAVIRQQYDGTRMTYVDGSASPAADGPPATCLAPFDTSKMCLTWTLATPQLPGAENTYSARFDTGGGGQTTSVTQAIYTSDTFTGNGYETSALTIITGIARPVLTLDHDLDQTTTFSTANNSADLIGTVKNTGTNDFDIGSIFLKLPTGWTVSGDLTVGGINYSCVGGCATNNPEFDLSLSHTAGTSLVSLFSVDVPPGETTGLYTIDMQIWGSQTGFGGEYETYFPELATVNIGAVRTEKPTIDCPVGSTSTSVTGDAEVNADVSLLFNLMERGTCTANGSGDWDCTFASFGAMYGGLEVRARAQLTGELESELSDPCEVTPKRECSDGIDNDGDGLIDFPADPGCDSPTDSSENTDASIECMDGTDNEPDGTTDWPEDLSCSDETDTTETGNPACSDGIDNDGDGLTDFAAVGGDPDCVDANDPTEQAMPECQDRVDNDSDGLIDFPADPGCHSTFDSDETDLGFVPEDSKPRLLIVFDTSGSMNWNTCDTTFTGGDGSADCPGDPVACADLDPMCMGGSALTCDNGIADDSRLHKVKRGISDVVAGFGEAEYALMRFKQRGTDFSCPSRNAGLKSGGWQGGGAAPCGGGFSGGDVVVSFSPDNAQTMIKWMDGETNFPGGGDPAKRLDWELRGSGTTPIAGALGDALTYLTGVQGVDPRSACRPYRVVLVTDGQETCGGDPVAAATALKNAGFLVSVIGFATTDGAIQTELNGIANAGSASGTDLAIFVDDETSLTSAIASIITSSILVELCNDLDDDCDGLFDEDFPDKGNACDNGQFGSCARPGTIVCSADERGTECNAPDGSGSSTVETCNLADDDCDDKVDEGLVCTCAGQELCNDLDDDCDGNVDEGTIPGVGTTCGISIGECETGTIQCVDQDATVGNGNASLECVGAIGPVQPDLCDGDDNDCDTLVDEDFAQQCYTGTSGCVSDGSGGFNCQGICKSGTLECNMGVVGACTGQVTPGVETCNGVDDDCDGTVDEDWMPDTNGNQLGAVCDNGDLGACFATGVWACNTAMPSGALVCTAPTISSGTEICNGSDDDCDGSTDEMLGSPIGDTCGAVGCMPGLLTCVDPDMNPLTENSEIQCVGTMGGSAEVCNGVDDDCDVTIDEDVAGVGIGCYPAGLAGCTGDATIGFTCEGICQPGTTICAPPNINCDGFIGPETEDSCDGMDNDCDGNVDEGATCPGPGDICSGGGCVTACDNTEFPCAFGFFCKVLDDSKCTNPPCRFCFEDQCTGVTCQPGETCEPETGACNDPCDTTTCQTGETCFAGGCFDCFDAGFGCPSGENCIAGSSGVGTCETDLCFGVICGPEQFCRDGDCVDITCDPECVAGERCVNGSCEADLCADVTCTNNRVCNPTNGECESDLCVGVNCPAGQACQPSTGGCAADSCALIDCPVGFECTVDFAGNGVCTPETETGAKGELIVATGGGGCDTGSGQSGGTLALMLVGLALVLRRRKDPA